MTHTRQWLVTIAMAAVLGLSFAPVASADPGDPGGGFSSASAPTETTSTTSPGKKK